MNAFQKVQNLRNRKPSQDGTPRIAALTAYDYPTARLIDESSVDLILVGDSLGMVALGFPDTTHVTLAHMVHHTQAVARATKRALLISDLPINTYLTVAQSIASAKQLCQSGAEAVKLEGGRDQLPQIKALIKEGIPVIGHLGMLPQQVLIEGGYKKKGKKQSEVQGLLQDAQALEDAGVSALVLESVIPPVAAQITQLLSIPTIGIGSEEYSSSASFSCDGEIAVVTDLLGSYPWFVPPFARPEADLSRITKDALISYCQRIQSPFSLDQ